MYQIKPLNHINNDNSIFLKAVIWNKIDKKNKNNPAPPRQM